MRALFCSAFAHTYGLVVAQRNRFLESHEEIRVDTTMADASAVLLITFLNCLCVRRVALLNIHCLSIVRIFHTKKVHREAAVFAFHMPRLNPFHLVLNLAFHKNFSDFGVGKIIVNFSLFL